MPELLSPARRLIRVVVSVSLVAVACSPAQPETGRKPAGRAVAPDSVPFAPPADSLIPNDAAGRSIRRGLALLVNTRDSLPGHVGGALQCVSCHPEAGRKPGAMPWVGVYARYPQYRSRSASVGLLEDRVNDCFLRSMNGKPLDPAGADMRDIVAYMAFLSRGVPVGAKVAGQGLTMLPAGMKGDSARGAALFPVTCARCHGPGGEGSAVYPPLWGARSFNIGAGMARVRTAAAFIRHNMPFDKPGTLTDQQASDLAAYVTSQPRPDLPGKEKDWPEGGAPADVPYRTLGAHSVAPAATHR